MFIINFLVLFLSIGCTDTVNFYPEIKLDKWVNLDIKVGDYSVRIKVPPTREKHHSGFITNVDDFDALMKGNEAELLATKTYDWSGASDDFGLFISIQPKNTTYMFYDRNSHLIYKEFKYKNFTCVDVLRKKKEKINDEVYEPRYRRMCYIDFANTDYIISFLGNIGFLKREYILTGKINDKNISNNKRINLRLKILMNIMDSLEITHKNQ